MTDLTNKFKFYQEMGLWPRTIKLNYNLWLKNFKAEADRKIAEQILDFFVYYSDDLVNQLLIAVIGKCGYKLQQKDPDWTHDKFKKERDTELIPLEGLLSSECLTKVFSEDDLFMFKMAFTKDGYNIRNDVAHGMLLPQEYNSMRTLMVFVSIIRLSKATSYIVDLNGKSVAMI